MTTIDTIGDGCPEQVFLEQPGLGGGAVDNRHFLGTPALAQPLFHLLDDKTGLVLFVEGGVECNGCALVVRGPQLLAHPVIVIGNQGIGCLEDITGGAVVLLQLDDFYVCKIAAEMLHVLNLGTTPPINGLVIVPDHQHAAVIPGQHTYPGVLDGIGVLEFVYQQVAQAVTVMFQ